MFADKWTMTFILEKNCVPLPVIIGYEPDIYFITRLESNYKYKLIRHEFNQLFFPFDQINS
jgi:hypothetical protein